VKAGSEKKNAEFTTTRVRFSVILPMFHATITKEPPQTNNTAGRDALPSELTVLVVVFFAEARQRIPRPLG